MAIRTRAVGPASRVSWPSWPMRRSTGTPPTPWPSCTPPRWRMTKAKRSIASLPTCTGLCRSGPCPRLTLISQREKLDMSTSTQLLADLATHLASGSVEVVDLSVTLSPETPVIRLPDVFAQSPGVSFETISEYDEKGGNTWYWR